MKKNLLIIKTLFALLASNNVLADKNIGVVLDVQLTIIAGCYIENNNGQRINKALGTINFGNNVLDLNKSIRIPFSTNIDNSTLDLHCSSDTQYTIKINEGINFDGSQRRLINDTDANVFVKYNLYQDAEYKTPWTADGQSWRATSIEEEIPLKIYAEVPEQITPKAGIYSDNLLVSVIW